MKEIRGAAAITYARINGLYFDIDHNVLTEAEGELTGRSCSIVDVDRLLEDRLGLRFDPVEIAQGGEAFDFLVNRYGDDWIYVAVEGDDPDAEEKGALKMFRRLLREREPAFGSDVRGLLEKYGPRPLREQSRTDGAVLNLLFHASLRLARKGFLESVEDPETLRRGGKANYGFHTFLIPVDFEVSLTGVLCEMCRGERLATTVKLHRECAKRLRAALAKPAVQA